MQPQLIVTIQPVGAKFDPPAPLTLPNVDAHAPGAEVEMYSFDHDLEEFVAIGLGTVSVDGSVIESNPGVGVVKAGWHCGSQPAGAGDVEDCPKIVNHLVTSTNPYQLGGTVYIDSAPATIRLQAQGSILGPGTSSCSAITYEWQADGYNGGLAPIDSIQLTLTHDGVYRFKSILTADCGCNAAIKSVRDIKFVVGKLNITSSTDAGSAAADSFIVDSTLSGSITADVPAAAMLSGESVQWKIEALKGRKKDLAYGTVVVQTAHVVVGGTGAYNDALIVNTPTDVNTIAFDPVPPHHLPTAYTRGSGTTEIDVHTKNPRLGYRITASLARGGVWIPFKTKIVQMDDVDMIRQEYVTHISSAESTLGAGVANVSVPTRNQFTALANMPAGDWVEQTTYGTELRYGYTHLVQNGIVRMWTDYQTAWNATNKTIPLSVNPYTATMNPAHSIRVSSGYRNPERQEFYSSAKASRHMLGRALDIAATGVPLLYKWVNGVKKDNPTFARGVAFQIAWDAMSHVALIPYWDFWQLEDRRAYAIRKSSTGWVINSKKYSKDRNLNGILDGYEVTGHLHLQDDPTVGVH